MYINFNILEKENLTFPDLKIFLLINQKELSADKANMIEPLLKKYIHDGYLKEIKTGKTFLDRLRVTKRTKELLVKLSIMDENDEVIQLATELIDLFESYSKEYGNKMNITSSLCWFISKTAFTPEQIKESVEEWLSNDWKMWLENIIWDKKKANVFTTIASRQLSQSPLYEFMRRKYSREY